MDECIICGKESKNVNTDLFDESDLPPLCPSCYAQGKMLINMFGSLDWDAFRMFRDRETTGSQKY